MIIWIYLQNLVLFNLESEVFKMKRKNGDLKIVRVYTQDGKQVAFDVQNAAGTQRVDKATVVGAIKNGHSYVNATVTSSGVVRVDANVPRQPIKQSSSNINSK